MSSVKIQGNASGTGILTIAAPNTNTDRTLTLPDQSGELMALDGGPINVSSSAADNSVLVAASGKVGIHNSGNTYNATMCDIYSANASEFALTVRQDSTTGAYGIGVGSDTAELMYFYTNHTLTTLIGSITHNGSNTIYGTTSDYRLKEDYAPISNPVDRVKSLNPINFKWKSTGQRSDGFLAHELQSVVPEAVFGEKDGVSEDGSYKLQQVDMGNVVPLLTAALQEALARIDTLEAKVAVLEGGA